MVTMDSLRTPRTADVLSSKVTTPRTADVLNSKVATPPSTSRDFTGPEISVGFLALLTLAHAAAATTKMAAVQQGSPARTALPANIKTRMVSHLLAKLARPGNTTITPGESKTGNTKSSLTIIVF